MIRKLALPFLVLGLLAGCWGEDDAAADWSKLGTEPFDAANWAASNQTGRGPMVADLLKQNDLIGKSYDDVVALLGQPTGYYDYDSNLAYIVGPKGRVESVYADGYMLVFSMKDGAVSGIKAVPDIE